MLESFFESIGNIILIFILIYLLIWLVLRLFGKSIMRMIAKRLFQKSAASFSHSSYTAADSSEPAGRTSIYYQPPDSRKIRKETGEYVDFEEID